MNDTKLILDAIADVKQDITKVLDDHEERIRSNERSILKFKTLGSAVVAVASFLGWDVIKHHFFKTPL